MNCINHPDVPAIAYCRSCGKALCEACRRLADGTVFCDEHVPVAAAAAEAPSPYTAPTPLPSQAPIPDAGASPGLAFLLGLIPGVGAIYNGQYVKGLIHVVVLGILISIVSSNEASGGLEPLFGMMIALWVFYMAFEAYHTAKRRALGQPVDEFSSIVPRRGETTTRFPLAPVVLIAVGLLFLLNNLDILRFGQLIRYWPIALIALGVYLLYERVAASDRRDHRGPTGVREATNERH
jgi:cell wall-active antibiotic response 4TMS protein YvqF/B-box zinc finger protein